MTRLSRETASPSLKPIVPWVRAGLAGRVPGAAKVRYHPAQGTLYVCRWVRRRSGIVSEREAPFMFQARLRLSTRDLTRSTRIRRLALRRCKAPP